MLEQLPTDVWKLQFQLYFGRWQRAGPRAFQFVGLDISPTYNAIVGKRTSESCICVVVECREPALDLQRISAPWGFYIVLSGSVVLRTRYDLYMPLVPIWKGPRTDQSCENSNSGSSDSTDSILTSEDSALAIGCTRLLGLRTAQEIVSSIRGRWG